MPTGHESDERIHRLARLLRHEVGDLLQSVYSTVAVLLDRLPSELTLERRLIGDLKSRAELCKAELDAVVELASGATAAGDRVELAEVFSAATAQARLRYPAVPLNAGPAPHAAVELDARALGNALWLLLRSMCQSARQQVTILFERGERHVDCWISRDGYPLPAEQLAWLHEPFPTTQNAAFGLALALLQRTVAGGEVEAGNRPDGVFVRIRFPVRE